jgi:septum site-determining protein MinC
MEPSSRKKELSFKGRGSALRVAFEGAMVPGIIDVMTELRDAGNLVLSHPLIIDFKTLSVSRTWLLAFLRDVVFPMNLSVTLWAATDRGTLDTLASLGFKLDSGDRSLFSPSSLKIVTTPLRSGQTLFHEGDVLMLGPLHSGAEISATGSIIVLGDLEGLVHAGCTGNNNASVVTTGYRTNQMRIGSMISNVMEPGASPWWGRPVRIYVEGGVFVASDIVHSKDR